MHLYRVLEDEYINLYGPLPAEYPWLFLQSHIKDRQGLIKKIREADRPLDSYLKQKFEEFIEDQKARPTYKLADPKSIKAKLEGLQDRQTRKQYEPDDPHGEKLAKQVRKLELHHKELKSIDPQKRVILKREIKDLNKLKALPGDGPRSLEVTNALVEVLNQVLTDENFHTADVKRFSRVYIKEDTQRLITAYRRNKATTEQSLTVQTSTEQPQNQTATPPDATEPPGSKTATSPTSTEPSMSKAPTTKQPKVSTKICRINRFLLEDAYPDEIQRRDLENVEGAYRSYIAAIYSAIHKRERSALCLSGGGIRSATFNLGILQGLARHGLLDKFDYLLDLHSNERSMLRFYQSYEIRTG